MAPVKKITSRSGRPPWPPRPPRRGAGAPLVLVGALPALLWAIVPSEATAACRVLRGADESPRVLSVRLSRDCTDRDREAEAVAAGEVLRALEEDRDVDLVNVLVTGDLLFPSLPTVSLDDLARRHPDAREALGDDVTGPARAASGRLSIRDSIVRGRIAANSNGGYLILGGPLVVTGTTFRRTVDFTRTLFVGPVDASRSRFEREAFFIQSRFLGGARFEEASFGVRARFHRSRFTGPAVFRGSEFNGMAEFLEVAFMRRAGFSRARFRLAAGFSGSRFEGPLDFSDAHFGREAFFLYTRFRDHANFRGATFRGLADFSHAEFHGTEDFATAFFDREPRFSRSRSKGMRPPRERDRAPRVLYGVAAVLMALTLLLLWTRRGGSSTNGPGPTRS